MSTPIVATSELSHVLSDYRLHLTGYDDSIQIEEQTQFQAQNPPNWPTDRHRIPSYRPVNRNLDPNERPRGSNPAEFIFINIMFTGVFLNASLAKLWSRTGGPYFPGLFKYAVGGEW